jgi:hypothetical protein
MAIDGWENSWRIVGDTLLNLETICVRRHAGDIGETQMIHAGDM